MDNIMVPGLTQEHPERRGGRAKAPEFQPFSSGFVSHAYFSKGLTIEGSSGFRDLRVILFAIYLCERKVATRDRSVVF